MLRNEIKMVLLAALVSSIAPAPSTAISHDLQVTPPKELADLPARWRGAMKDFQIPGMAVAVIRDNDVILLETFGVRDPTSQQPVTRDTVFYLASCTKAFTATAVMQLVEKDKIDLDAPVKSYLPRFELADAKATRELTVRDLLSHAKGLSSDPIVWLEAYTGEITDDRFYHFLKRVKPTGSFRYSNLHYTIAGRIIESVTGKHWKDVLTNEIFSPLGMTSTTCDADMMYSISDVAIPSDFRKGRLVIAATRKNNKTMHAAGGNGASIKDLVMWMQFNLGGTNTKAISVLSSESLQEMQTSQVTQSGRVRVPGQTRTGYGFGWNIGEYKGEEILEHGGAYAGTSVAISFLPGKKIGVAVLCNSGAPLPPFFTADVFDRLLGVTPTDVLPQQKKGFDRWLARQSAEGGSTELNPAVAANGLSLSPRAYVGLYANEYWGTIQIELKNGEFAAQMGSLPLELVSKGMDRFSTLTSAGTPIAGRFELHTDGKTAGIALAIDEGDREVKFVKR